MLSVRGHTAGNGRNKQNKPEDAFIMQHAMSFIRFG
jgi:hypothetical protein